MASTVLSVAKPSSLQATGKGLSEFSGLRSSSPSSLPFARKSNDDLFSVIAFQTSALTQGKPLPLQIRKSTHPWTQRNSVLQPMSHNLSSFPKRALKLQANKTKGFGGVPAPEVTLPEKNIRRDESVTRNDNKNDDDDDKIAPVVWERMVVRILFSVGTPMATGLALLYIFGTLKDNHIWDVPLWLPFLSTLIAFGTSAIGIAYGTLSTSLDPEKKGSLLGWEQVQQNWPELWKEDIE